MSIPFIAAVLIVVQPMPHTAPARPQNAFPQRWVGHWRGPCTYVPAKGATRSFEMELNVAPTEDPARFKWEIVYVEGGQRQVRPYELLVVDAAQGKYVIDEKNSIKLESTFIDGALYSQFDVMTVRITASYRLEDERIIVELITTDPKSAQQTGGIGETPPVTGCSVRGIQRAVLSKV